MFFPGKIPAMQKIKTAVIPVAGFGTRFLPASKAFSKALLPILDRPLAQILVEDAVAAGIKKIIFVVSPGRDDVRKFFEPDIPLERKLAEKGNEVKLAAVRRISELADFEFVEQSEMLGDGHAILQSRELVDDENFLVIFGDDLIFGESSRQLVDAFESKNGAIVGLQKVARKDVSKFGIVAIDADSRITEFVEKPAVADAPSELAIIGKYVVPRKIFEILAENPNKSGEIRLIDALEILAKTDPVFGEVLDGERFDCGNKIGWLAANIFAGKNDPEIAKNSENE